jgi:hypothetical protein
VRFATFGFEVVFLDDAEVADLLADGRDAAEPLLALVEVLLVLVPEDLPVFELPLDDLAARAFPPDVLLLERPLAADAFFADDDDEELFPLDEETAFPLDFDFEPPVDFDGVDLAAVERPLDGLFARPPVPGLLPLDREVFVPRLLDALRPVAMVSAAAPTAPTAAPAAAPEMISPATSTTFSTIAEAVDLRLRDEREDVEPLRFERLELDLLAIELPSIKVRK